MALDEWLAVDGVSRSDAPEAYADIEGVALRQEALVLAEKKTLTVVPWKSILSVVQVDDRVYALCPRRPPAPPWVELDEEDAAGLRESLDSLRRNIEARAQRVGYRDAAPTRARLSPSQLHDRLVANDPVPGTVEVPVGLGPFGRTSRSRQIGRAVAGAGMGAVGGAYGGAILMAVFASHPTLALVGSTITATIAGSVGMVRLAADKKGKGRVLALAPDGVVIGLPEGVRAYAWSALGAFRDEVRDVADGSGRSFPHLVVTGADGQEVGAIDEAWFDRPLAVIVQVAEAYRSRFTER